MQIPLPVLDDLCLRFVDNIPDSERNDPIRVCFQIEQAHWFYVDYYCEGKRYPNCPNLNFQNFTKQLIKHNEALFKYRNYVDEMIEQFRSYKSFIPTYGAIMFDSTYTRILLVQGYFASKNSWGFPKGKVNEEEDPKVCAIREVFEETGYDISKKIVSGVGFNYILNDTMVHLYVAADVDHDFRFQPHLRKEIRKIAWFNVLDLPRHKSDFEICAMQGLRPNNFYSVLPAVDFIRKYSAEQLKIRQFSQKKLSAFQRVIPKAQKQLPTLPSQGFSACALENCMLNESCLPSTSHFVPYNNLQPVGQPTITSPNSSHDSASSSNLFASFCLDSSHSIQNLTRPHNLGSTSKTLPEYTSGSENVLKSLLKTPTAAQNAPSLYNTVDIPIAVQDVGESSQKSSRNNLEIKHPIPIQSSSIIKQSNLGNMPFNPTHSSSFVNVTNLSNTTLQSQLGNISSNRLATSERDFSMSPREEKLNYSTPPLLLPSDLLTSSLATNEALNTQTYLEACKLLVKSPYQKKRTRGSKRATKQTDGICKRDDDAAELSLSSNLLISTISKSPPITSKSPECPSVSEILSNMFLAARSTGGVIKANDLIAKPDKELKPVFNSEIEDCISGLKTKATTSEIVMDKFSLSEKDSAGSRPRIYETVYYNEQSDTDSEENQPPIFDIASNDQSDQDNDSSTLTVHSENNDIRVGPLELCRAWKNFHLDLSKTTLASLFN